MINYENTLHSYIPNHTPLPILTRPMHRIQNLSSTFIFAPFELRKRFCRIDKLWEYQNGFLGILTATAIFWSCTYYIKKSRFKYVLNKSCYINNIWIQWGNKYSISACCIMVGLWSWFRINEHTLFKISWFLFCNEGYQKYVRYFNMPICEYIEQTTN